MLVQHRLYDIYLWYHIALHQPGCLTLKETQGVACHYYSMQEDCGGLFLYCNYLVKDTYVCAVIYAPGCNCT